MFTQTLGNKAHQALIEEKGVLPSLMLLLEHSSIVIRGKALLAFYLLFRLNLRWLMVLAENKFISILDRLTRDNYKYVQCCLANVVELIVELIPIILKNILEELTKMKQQSESNSTLIESNSNKDLHKSSSLLYLPMILNVMNSQLLKSKVFTQNFLMTIFNIFDVSEGCKRAKIVSYYFGQNGS